MAFKSAGIEVEFKGHEVDETAVITAFGSGFFPDTNALKIGQTVMRINPKFYRPAEVELLIGNPAKAKAKLGWQPTTTLEQLCGMMVEQDVRRNRRGFSF